MANTTSNAKLEVIADMLAEDGKPGKVLDGWTLVREGKERNPNIAEVYKDVRRKLAHSDSPNQDFLLAREKGEASRITALFTQNIPDDNAEKVLSDAENKGAVNTTGMTNAEKQAAKAASNANAAPKVISAGNTATNAPIANPATPAATPIAVN